MARQLQIVAALGLGLFALQSAPAYAQATRTWVSGVGDDVNPCSRTAPCKTFAGAISKTAAAGTINCLDPGGFGAVTVTKSITINCDTVKGSILASSTNGIVVNAAATDVVVISGLDIDGGTTATPGLSGVRVLQAATVQVRNTTISGFSVAGISFLPTNVSQLFVTDTVIHDNVGASAAGIAVQPSGSGAANVHLNAVRLESNTTGLAITGGGTVGINVNVQSSMFAGNTSAGLSAVSTAGLAGIAVAVTSSQFSGNFGPAVRANGVAAGGLGSAIARVGSSMITANTTAISVVGSGIVRSYGDNKVNGNGGGEAFSANEPMK